jgi:hypothetical protein
MINRNCGWQSRLPHIRPLPYITFVIAALQYAKDKNLLFAKESIKNPFS